MSPQPTPTIAHFGFLTLRQFSMIAFTNAIEPLRMANYLAEQTIYRWSVYSLDGEPVPASNGLTVTQTQRIDESDLPDILFVCAGVDVQHAVDDMLTHFLRRLARKRIVIGALCTGSYALAKAGLLDGYRCAIHWENLSALRETFPQIVKIDGKRQNRHYLRSFGDDELGAPPAQQCHFAQVAVVESQHPRPGDPLRINVQGIPVKQMVIDKACQKIMRGGDRMRVPRQMQIDVLQGNNLGTSPAGGTTLDAENRAQGGLAQGHNRPVTQPAQSHCQANGGDGFALAKRGRINRGNQDILAELARF